MENVVEGQTSLPNRPLHPRKQRAVSLFEQGYTNEYIARKCRVRPETVSRWKRMKCVQSELTARQMQRDHDEKQRMRNLLADSIRALSEGLQPGRDLSLRVSVAQHVMKLAKPSTLQELYQSLSDTPPSTPAAAPREFPQAPSLMDLENIVKILEKAHPPLR